MNYTQIPTNLNKLSNRGRDTRYLRPRYALLSAAIRIAFSRDTHCLQPQFDNIYDFSRIHQQAMKN